MTSTEKAKQMMQGKTETKPGALATVPPTMSGLKTTQVKDVITRYRVQIAQALPKHLTADRIIQMSTTLISRNPDLKECTTESLIGAVMQASILGFEPVAALGHCYFVPFRNKHNGNRQEVQFIIGYKGMIDLARRSDQIKTIYAQAVYSNDEFEYTFGLEPDITHKPALSNRGEITHFYAVAKYMNGGVSFEVMSKDDVNKIRSRSKANGSSFSPWANPDDYPEMGKKTVIRRLFKYLPISIEKMAVTDGAVITPDAFDAGELDPNRVDNVDAKFGVPEHEQTEQKDPALFEKESA